MQYTADEKRRMSMNRIITILKDRTEKFECDSDCDETAPYKLCDECRAAEALNEADDILRNAL